MDSTHQLLNLGIVQADDIILRSPIRKHHRIRLDRLRAVGLLSTPTANEPVVRSRVIWSRVNRHAVPVNAIDIGAPFGRPAATAGEAQGIEVPVSRDAAVGNGGGVAGAADVGVDAGANGGGAGAVAGVVEVYVNCRDGGNEA